MLSCLLAVAGCSTPEKPPPPPETVAPPLPPPVRRQSVIPIRTTWSFTTDKDECVAVAAAGATALRIVVHRAVPIRLAVSVQPVLAADQPDVPLRFSGPAGNWRLAARRFGPHELGATMTADNLALSRVLVLLSGGGLDIGPPDHTVASLAIGASDTKGQLWFDCARDKMP